MTSFNDVPIELLEYIIDLSVETDILLQQETSRRTTLLNLSLVSKQFTTPAQNALWKRLEFGKLECALHSECKIMSLIEQGFARTKAVEFFHFLYVNDLKNNAMLWKIVKGVRQISSLKLRGPMYVRLDLRSLFLLPSLQNLRVLDLSVFRLNASKITLPSTTQEIHLISAFSNSHQLHAVLDGLKALPNANVSVEQDQADPYRRLENYGPLLKCFQLHASRIQKYTISYSGREGMEFIELVMPCLPYLSSLTLNGPTTFMYQVSVLSLLQPTVPLEILELSISSLVDYYVDFLLPLLQLPQLEGLKELYNYFHPSYDCGESYEKGGRERINIRAPLRKEMDRSVELCRKKGIALHFARHVNVLEYKAKRRIYTLMG